MHNVSTARDLIQTAHCQQTISVDRAVKYYPGRYGNLLTRRIRLPFRNTNHLVYRDNWNIQLTKTGFTNAAGHCLAMRTVINNKTGGAGSDGRVWQQYTHFADASRLRTWIETGKVMPVRAAALTINKKPPKMAAAGDGTERLCEFGWRYSAIRNFTPLPASFSVYWFYRSPDSCCWSDRSRDRTSATSPVLYTNDRRYARQGIARRAAVGSSSICSFNACTSTPFHYVILMEDIAHKMAVIELVHQLAVDLRR